MKISHLLKINTKIFVLVFFLILFILVFFFYNFIRKKEKLCH
ncbi:hypothetical protein HMPREF0367_00789 [[Eubacterium] cylindroides ATCC 27803]|uniref:Uncharacterized protein n=1 Tax=Faecalitalea cylindroides ATCC 27803 TaxID=649755 RepID=U2PPK2_9FIRM|nr:hypothetical protein HMPREF0367_00789 [[Eubacterium] cylindroides ATCC 27803] [Faecalitalea cylindroides ATCC 27803]